VTTNWNTTWSLERAVAFLGTQHVAWLRTCPHPAGTAESRAHGAWMANDGEDFAAYNAIAKHFRETSTREGNRP